MTSLSGKVAIVTGGGQGLGEAIAHALAQQGATVICGDIQQEKANRVAEAQLQVRVVWVRVSV